MELKEAIEILKKMQDWYKKGNMSTTIESSELESICIVLQALEGLQEEHELYKDKIVLLSDEEYRKVIDAAQKDCISKDKIKEKIEKVKENYEEGYAIANQGKLDILEELLKGE